MKIICIADTHNKHHELIIPPGDVIIHAGDFTDAGTRNETLNFLNWFSQLPHPHKILIAGNHDFYFDKENLPQELIPGNIHYLQDSGVTINRVKFWGSPYTPGNRGWAFQKERGQEMGKHWDQLTSSIDYLITHTPPYRILDELDNKQHIGCEMLAKKIKALKIPCHVFGHNHNDYGIVRTKNTMFLNASCLDNNYRPINAPLVIHHLDT